MTKRGAIVLAVALLLGAPAGKARAAEADPLSTLAKAHARRLATFGAWCKESRQGALALRAYETAYAFDPENEEAKEALGWTKAGNEWKPPDPRVAPGEGWPDDGEAKVDEAAKRETTLRSDHVKGLLAAADAAKVRKAPPEDVARLLWAVLAADPGNTVARRLLGHGERAAGGYVAPEDVPLLDRLAKQAEGRAAFAKAKVDLKASSPPAPLDGWPQGVSPGVEGPGGDAAFSLTDPSWTAPLAKCLWLGRAQLALLLGLDAEAASKAILRLAVLHVGGRALAEALIDAAPGLSDPQRALAKRQLGAPLSGGKFLLVAVSPLPTLLDSAITLQVNRTLSGESAEGRGWLSFALAQVATRRLLGTSLGYASARQRFAGDLGPVRAPDEPLDAFVRRVVTTCAAPPISEMTTRASGALPPREVALLGSFLEWLYLSDPAKAAVFVASYRRAVDVEGPKRMADALAAAGLPPLASLDEAWRRYVIDTYPVSPSPVARDAAGGAWTTTKLDAVKALPAAESLFAPLSKPVSGALWYCGRPWTCEAVEGGSAVRLYPLGSGKPSRVVREPGTYPFNIFPEYGGRSLEVHVALAREASGWTVRSADAFSGAVDGVPLTFLDVDVDARFGSFDADGYVVGASPFVLPLRREIVVGSKAIEIRRVGPNGSEVAWRARPLAAKGRDLEALLRLNSWRTAAGVPALDGDPDASVGALLHAEYLARAFPGDIPDAEAAREDADKPGATGAGSQWAAEGIVFRASSPAFAVDRCLASLRAREVLLDPDARRLASAYAGGIAAFSLVGPEPGSPASRFRGPVAFPAPNAKEIPLRAGSDAVSLVGVPEAGFPLTLQFRRGEDLSSLAVEATLSGASGAPVELVKPDPVRARAAAPGCAVFVPKAPLAARTTFRATASFTRGGKKETLAWTFTTGS